MLVLCLFLLHFTVKKSIIVQNVYDFYRTREVQ